MEYVRFALKKIFGARHKFHSGTLENMASNCQFNPSVFAKHYLREEETPEYSLAQVNTPTELLEQVQKAVSGKSPLLSRAFKQVGQEQGVDKDNVNTNEAKTFRVMQWNILAQALSAGSDNFVRCPQEALEWGFRRNRLMEEILNVNPDILCLQEVDHFGFFLPVMEKIGYCGSFFPKPDSPCFYANHSNGPDGCAIFFRKSKFISKGKEQVVLLLESPRGKHEETNQVAIIYKLALSHDPNCEVTIATTHLKAKPGWEDLRKLQASYLINYLRPKVGEKPLIVCGDFNAEPTEPVYEMFSTDSLGLQSAYTKLEEPHGTEPPYTTWKIRGGRAGKESDVRHTIDYVWYTEKNLHLKTLLQFPSGDEMGPDRLPSYQYPSDHLSLAADFIFK